MGERFDASLSGLSYRACLICLRQFVKSKEGKERERGTEEERERGTEEERERERNRGRERERGTEEEREREEQRKRERGTEEERERKQRKKERERATGQKATGPLVVSDCGRCRVRSSQSKQLEDSPDQEESQS
ncbi:hypothetical protein KUCAC02_033266 [Chaenocephalus aceratus]|nr:hypothetical protein KUCAC02_033266 [Chaenocephalus aceratus]